jgi:hypothetical protein
LTDPRNTTCRKFSLLSVGNLQTDVVFRISPIDAR